MMAIDDLANRLRPLLDEEAAIDLLRRAVGRESVTGDEANMVAFLEGEMASLNLGPLGKGDFLPGRPNIWGRRPGKGDGPHLMFVGHTDTVHVEGWREKWAGTEREDPFAGALVDGAIWGRGAGDLKAGICAGLAALVLLDRAGLTLAGDVSFAFVGDEESGQPGTGVSAGIKHFTASVSAGRTPKPDFAVYVEPTRLAVYPAQIGFFIADIEITGKTAYFGVPELGRDALKAAHQVLSALWVHSAELGQAGEHDLVGRSFLLVTEIRAGGYIAVPGECSLSLIGKLRPGEDLDKAASALESVVHAAVTDPEIKVKIAYPAGRDHALGGSPVEIDPAMREVASLAACLDAACPGRGRIEGAPFWSETPFLIKEIGCPAVYCAPGDIRNCHTLEEHVEVEEYLAGIVAFAAFMAAYCGLVED
ncbi:MAG: M20 family metallopeptidase [Geminicoccaceae bacterium]